MELRAIQYYVAVVENGSITAAARELHMSQPPLSTQIKALENELGTQLLIRHPRNVEMTDAGRVFYERAKTLLAFQKSTVKEVENFAKGQEGTIRIGIPSSCDGVLLSFVEEHFHNEHPDIYFEITEANTYELINKLDRKSIDLALARTPYDINESLYNVHEIMSDSIMAVGYKKYFEGLKGANIVSTEELEGKPLLTYRRWEPIISYVFKATNRVPDYMCLSDSAHTAVMWAERGLGIAIVPRTALPIRENNNIVEREIVSDQLKTSICAITRKDAYLSPCTKLFMDAFEKEYGI